MLNMLRSEGSRVLRVLTTLYPTRCRRSKSNGSLVHVRRLLLQSTITKYMLVGFPPGKVLLQSVSLK